MSEYASVKRGALSVKGGLFKKKKKKSKRPKVDKGAASGAAAAQEEEDDEDFKVCTGSGRISSSGTTVMGYESKFMDELHVGDAIIVSHPNTLTDETRIVKMARGWIPFSTDLITTCGFRYISAPRVVESAALKDKRMRELADGREDTAVGDYAGSGGKTLVYRKRKVGAVGGSNGYAIVTEKLDREVTRTEMLELRSKYKSDRHCA